MAVGAAAAGEVVGALAMTTEARIARGSGLLLVASVAIAAGLMLDLEVQSGQLQGLMAAGAGGWLGDASGTVGSMAREAAGAQFAVGTRGFVGMAAAAGFSCGGPGVRFVAARAVLVAAGRRLAF